MPAYRVVVTVEEHDEAGVRVLNLPGEVYETLDQRRATDVLYSVIGRYRGTYTPLIPQ